MKPTFSVVVPCRDQARFLATALDSALAQSPPPLEVIVVDDGSEDGSAGVAAGYGDRVVLLREEGRGLSAARNAALERVTGEFVVFLDADDYLDEGTLRAHGETASKQPDAAVLCGSWCLVDEQGRVLSRHAPPELPPDVYCFLLRGNPMPCHALAVRTDAVREAGAFDPALGAFEDWDLWLRIARRGRRFVTVPEAVAFYRRYPGTLSRDLGRMLEASRKVFRKNRGQGGMRLAHFLARLRAGRAIRYGLVCNELLPRARRLGRLELWRVLLRHPSLLEGVAIHGLFRVCPALRRRMGAAGPHV